MEVYAQSIRLVSKGCVEYQSIGVQKRRYRVSTSWEVYIDLCKRSLSIDLICLAPLEIEKNI